MSGSHFDELEGVLSAGKARSLLTRGVEETKRDLRGTAVQVQSERAFSEIRALGQSTMRTRQSMQPIL